jgi:rhodanese-related sulfurtransferase
VWIEGREIYVQLGVALHTMHDHKINLVMLDVRDEADLNLFPIGDARRVELDELQKIVPELHLGPANTVFILMSNDEVSSTEACTVLVAESVPSVYVLEGGVNGWLATFAEEEPGIAPLPLAADEKLEDVFAAALGAACKAAAPDPDHDQFEVEPKIKLEMRGAPTGGGCR